MISTMKTKITAREKAYIKIEIIFLSNRFLSGIQKSRTFWRHLVMRRIVSCFFDPSTGDKNFQDKSCHTVWFFKEENDRWGYRFLVDNRKGVHSCIFTQQGTKLFLNSEQIIQNEQIVTGMLPES